MARLPRVHAVVLLLAFAAPALASVFPGAAWETRTPAQVGLNASTLAGLQSYLGGRGAIVRHGYLVYTWGDAAARGDVASAAKPLYTHFLMEAVESGLLASLDTRLRTKEPCVGSLNPSLGFKDRLITFRHMANQVSCYGVSEVPGQAFNYNDWQMALLWDTLFLKVWGSTYADVDAEVLGAELGSVIQFENQPTFMAFGTGDRPGRLAISPRDFCRFGLLYLNRGDWNGTRVLSEALALTAVTRAVSPELPRTAAVESDMCAGQRSLGSANVPDDQGDQDGGYGWTWWLNGLTQTGARRWPDADANVYAAIGHDASEVMAVLPCLDLVVSWTDATPRPLNESLRRLYLAASTVPALLPAELGPVLRMNKVAGGAPRLDWTADPAAPRGSGQHYHVLRGVTPVGLDVAPGTHPWSGTTHVPAADTDTLVFYRVVAASACEAVSED